MGYTAILELVVPSGNIKLLRINSEESLSEATFRVMGFIILNRPETVQIISKTAHMIQFKPKIRYYNSYIYSRYRQKIPKCYCRKQNCQRIMRHS